MSKLFETVEPVATNESLKQTVLSLVIPENFERRKFLKHAARSSLQIAVTLIGISGFLSATKAHSSDTGRQDSVSFPSADDKSYKSVSEETISGSDLPEIFSPGVWTLPDHHNMRVDGIEMIITKNRKIIITLNGETVPFKIKNHKIILGGRLEDCVIEKAGAFGFYRIVISGTGFDNPTAVNSPIPLGQFSKSE